MLSSLAKVMSQTVLPTVFTALLAIGVKMFTLALAVNSCGTAVSTNVGCAVTVLSTYLRR